MIAPLDLRRSLPAGAQVEKRAMADGWRLRTMRWDTVPGAPGSILFLGGRGDFIEKYAEGLHDWRTRRYGLATFDWRGQGGSGRFLADPQKGHAPGFDPWRSDLAEQVAWFRDALPPPHFAVAHSMGGHLLLRHLQARPDDFVRVVLLAPMTGLLAVPIGPWLARRIATVTDALGLGEAYAPGSGPLVRGAPGSLRQRRLTHDLDRYADEGWWLAEHPELAIGGITSGWLASAFASLDALLAPGAIERVTTPLLVLVADGEGLVDNVATARAVARLPAAQLETIVGAGHELLREIDAIRLSVLDRMAAFLA